MHPHLNELFEQAKDALEKNEYARAEVSQRKGCELLRQAGGDEAALAAELEKLAGIHYTQKKFDLSASEYSEVIEKRRAFLPANDFAIIQPLFNLAKLHFENQKYDAAELEMREVLALAETYSDSRQMKAFFLYELGWLLYFVGKYRESEPYLLRSLPLCDETYGRSNSQTIHVLSAIARLYANSPDLGKDPEPFFRQAIEASRGHEELRGYNLSELCRLGNFFNESKRFDDADAVFLELLPFARVSADKTESCDWWIVASCIEYFTKRGRPEIVAEFANTKFAGRDTYGETVRDRLKHAEMTLSEDDPALVEALLNVGNHLTFDGKYSEAEPLLDRAVVVSLKANGENSSQTILAWCRVCIVKRLLAKFDEAESAIQEALRGAKQYFPNDGLYPWTLTSLALLREAEKRNDDAVKTFAQAVVEFERIFGFPSYRAVEALYRQAGLLLRTENLASAEVSIRRAIGAMDEIEHLSSSEKADYFATLASILESSGRTSEANEAQARADELFEESNRDNGDSTTS